MHKNQKKIIVLVILSLLILISAFGYLKINSSYKGNEKILSYSKCKEFKTENTSIDFPDVYTTLDELIDKSDVVIEGNILGCGDSTADKDKVELVVQVNDSHKGKNIPSEISVKIIGRQDLENIFVPIGTPKLDVGQTIVIFADEKNGVFIPKGGGSAVAIRDAANGKYKLEEKSGLFGDLEFSASEL
jgi:hypothetical protein